MVFKKGHKINVGRKFSGFFGKNHSKKAKDKMSSSKKGKKRSEEHQKKLNESLKGKHYSIKTEFKKGHRGKMVGEKHWNWQGGITSFNEQLRNSSKMKIWKELVFLRDNFTCQNLECKYCNNKCGGILLNAHHIKPFSLFPELRFKLSNGITYCAEFHHKSELHKNIQKMKEVRLNG